MEYFCFHWEESRGDQHDDWGTSWWYFEVADDGYVERQIEQYANGTCLAYDRGHLEDRFGGLAEKRVGRDDWPALRESSAEAFEAVWSQARPINRKRD
jgi:hypothetical protein